jgi:hypothetical protein
VYYNLIEMAIGAEINGKLVHKPEGKVPMLDQTDRLELPGPARLEPAETRRLDSGANTATISQRTA